jgi:organic radical activating enzyme
MRVLNLSEKEFCSHIKNRTVVCFGAGLMLDEAIHTLPVEMNIIGVFDNNVKKQNTFFLIGGREFIIRRLEDLSSLSQQNPVLLITSKYYREIIKQLNSKKDLERFEAIAYAALKLNIKKNTDDFFKVRVWDSCIKIYREFLTGQGFGDDYIAARLNDLQKYMNTNLSNGKRPFIIPRLVYIISSICNLRCKDCLALMPYYHKPSHIPLETILRDIHISLNAIDMCVGIELIGGETFLYPWLSNALQNIINNGKVQSIILSTNGTVLPKDDVLQLLSSPKILVRIGNYGFTDKMNSLMVLLEKNRVRFTVNTVHRWKDGGGVEYRNKTNEQIRTEFLNCENSRVSKTVLDGRLFVCPRSSRLYSLGLYTSSDDYIELNDTNNTNKIQKKLLNMYSKDSADACQYCDFGSLDPREIPAGIQI